MSYDDDFDEFENEWVDEEDEFDDDPEGYDPEPVPVTIPTSAPRYTASFDSEGNGLLTVIVENRPLTFGSEHPHFHRILGDVEQGLIPLDTDFEVVLESIPGVQVRDGVLYFDGYPVHSKLAEVIKRYFREGRDTANLTRFAERLQNNPSEDSREQLFTWADAANLTIDEDGYIIGFKSVTTDLRSHHIGPAIVNGEYYEPEDEIDDEGNLIAGRKGVPNTVGSVVELSRYEVDPDTGVACSTGLHFGSWNYAKRFGGHNNIILEVRVDPADVVSVPQDSSFQKVRCCRYEVVEVHDYNGVLSRYEPEATKVEDPAIAEQRISDSLAAQAVPRKWIDRILGRKRNA